MKVLFRFQLGARPQTLEQVATDGDVRVHARRKKFQRAHVLAVSLAQMKSHHLFHIRGARREICMQRFDCLMRMHNHNIVGLYDCA